MDLSFNPVTVLVGADAAGMTPNFDGALLGRCLRDMQVVPQQVVAPHCIEDAGRVLLDPLEPLL